MSAAQVGADPGAPQPAQVGDEVLADRDVVDDYALRRRRLRGALAQGRRWRVRPERNPVGYLLAGAVLALVALLVVGMIAFVRAQFADRATVPVTRSAPVGTQGVGWPNAPVGVSS